MRGSISALLVLALVTDAACASQRQLRTLPFDPLADLLDMNVTDTTLGPKLVGEAFNESKSTLTPQVIVPRTYIKDRDHNARKFERACARVQLPSSKTTACAQSLR